MREHGTYARYVWGPDENDQPGEHCRCKACRYAHCEYERQRKRRKAYGGEYWGWVDAEPVRQHVRAIMCKPTRSRQGGGSKRGTNREGVGLKRIAKLTGVSHGSLSKLIYGGPGERPPSRKIRMDSAEKLLALKGNEYADPIKVPAGPTWELVNEIVGWYNAEVGTPCRAGGTRHYGGKRWLGKRVHGPHAAALQLSESFVTAAHAQKIKALHDTLFDEHEGFRWRHCKCSDAEMRRAS